MLGFIRPIILLVTLCLCATRPAWADYFVAVDDARTVTVERELGTVFISNPNVADYSISGSRSIIFYGKSAGQSRFIAYDKQGNEILNSAIRVDVHLGVVRAELKKRFPQLDIRVTSHGDKVIVEGEVTSDKERDGVYRLVAELLGRSAVPRYAGTDTTSFDDSVISEQSWVNFARNFRYEGIIEQLVMKQPQQINVKISVAQVTQGFQESLGVNWSSFGAAAGEFVIQDFKADKLTTIINAMGDDNIAQILAEPNLTVMSGESASFLVGGEFPVISSNDGSTNISFKEYGVKLDLSAKVQDRNNIRLQLAPEVSAIESVIRAGGIVAPQLTSRKAMTTIELADGDSFVLGGLMSSDDFEQVSRIPLLGDIPVLGAAFRHASTTRKNTELVIVATVNMVQPTSPTEVVLPRIQPSSTLQRLFNLAPNQATPEQEKAIKLLNQGGFYQ